MLTISHEELGEELGDEVECPRCGEKHSLSYGTENGRPSKLLQFVHCTSAQVTYLVGINGRALPSRVESHRKNLREKEDADGQA